MHFWWENCNGQNIAICCYLNLHKVQIYTGTLEFTRQNISRHFLRPAYIWYIIHKSSFHPAGCGFETTLAPNFVIKSWSKSFNHIRYSLVLQDNPSRPITVHIFANIFNSSVHSYLQNCWTCEWQTDERCVVWNKHRSANICIKGYMCCSDNICEQYSNVHIYPIRKHHHVSTVEY